MKTVVELTCKGPVVSGYSWKWEHVCESDVNAHPLEENQFIGKWSVLGGAFLLSSKIPRIPVQSTSSSPMDTLVAARCSSQAPEAVLGSGTCSRML